MGSHINFKNFGDAPPGEGKLQGNYSLARQSSVYSLTFDEFQNTMGGFGKDFGSMNMDELLKNIWTAEEVQGMTCTVGGSEGNVPGGNLQRQGSLTLPRTISQKTVDEVWKDLVKESSDGGGGGGGAKVGNGNANGGSNANVPQRQPTLGEVTLEEFLVRAGVVREDIQPTVRPNNSVFYGELPRPNNNTSLTFEFQQPNRSNGVFGNRIMENNNSVPNQPPSLAMNVGGLRSSQQQIQQLQQQQQQPLFPKPTTVPFASPVHLVNNAQIANPGSRGSVVGVAEPSMNTALVQGGGIGRVGLAPGVVTSIAGSPVSQISSEAKSTIDSSSLSPVPYVFNRGRKCGGALEKVVERRQRRMIKNRESAARSRARKQAYTLELEAEVAKLKEMNQELQRKQEEIKEMEKNQKLETMNRQWGGKRQCLRRTLTGPW